MLCSELAAPPPQPFERLVDVVDYESARRDLQRDPSLEAACARRFARALARGPVYLLSQLPPSTVEAIGLIPLADEAELQRLADNCHHCVILHDAANLSLRSIAESDELPPE
ncbi:MAG: hypothetical protein KDA61_13955 [Planctomycetales bacterium]|nr:hypothetical protein [Planctomycetales bacterium]